VGVRAGKEGEGERVEREACCRAGQVGMT
jgi:hypothetical protein